MIYGMNKSQDILLSSIAHELDEKTKKVNIIERLSIHLAEELPKSINNNYLNLVFNNIGSNPVFLVDDSDVIKPLGEKFESMCIVRDGSSRKKNYEQGYHVCEIVALSEKMKQPISVYSKVYSSTEEKFNSTNNETQKGLDVTINKLNETGKIGLFIHDRGYDSNDLFNYYLKNKQHYIIRLTKKRNVYINGKKHNVGDIAKRKKGKVKINLQFQNEMKECYATCIKVKITANKSNINLVLLYGLGEEPLIIATNVPIKSKEDVIRIARGYINRWKIEEYFKFKKQEFGFENFRVRSLTSINNLNTILSYTIGFMAILYEKSNNNKFIKIIITESKSLKNKVSLWFYQISRGIAEILKNSRTGIRQWQGIVKRKEYNGQMSLF